MSLGAWLDRMLRRDVERAAVIRVAEEPRPDPGEVTAEAYQRAVEETKPVNTNPFAALMAQPKGVPYAPNTLSQKGRRKRARWSNRRTNR